MKCWEMLAALIGEVSFYIENFVFSTLLCDFETTPELFWDSFSAGLLFEGV